MNFTNDINAVNERIDILISMIQSTEEEIKFKKACIDGYKVELIALKYYRDSLKLED